MVMHTHDEVLLAVQEICPNAYDVSLVYKDDSNQWWVIDSDHNTFAFAWYDADNIFHIRDYRP